MFDGFLVGWFIMLVLLIVNLVAIVQRKRQHAQEVEELNLYIDGQEETIEDLEAQLAIWNTTSAPESEPDSDGYRKLEAYRVFAQAKFRQIEALSWVQAPDDPYGREIRDLLLAGIDEHPLRPNPKEEV